jgi:cyclopropane fatty-acyl-phospholipid synthase-like methyltransferase
MKEHWDEVYTETDDNKTGWFEEFPAPAVELLNECKLDKGDAIFIAGAGTSSFVDYLTEQNYTNIIAADISAVAIDKLKKRFNDSKSESVRFIVDDLTEPTELNKLGNLALWYDRAVLHFFTEGQQRLNYFTLLKKILMPGGYVIIAEFSPQGVKKCSGLDTLNYDSSMVQSYLGSDFKLLKTFDYLYRTPAGNPRPYIYSLFQRNGRPDQLTAGE